MTKGECRMQTLHPKCIAVERWFAWRPVRAGGAGGRLVWLEYMWKVHNARGMIYHTMFYHDMEPMSDNAGGLAQ